MSYISQLRVLQVTNSISTFVPVTVKLWHMWTTINSAGDAVDHEVEREPIVITPDGSTGVAPFSFALGPSFNISATDQSDKIALTIEDAFAPGFAFRSGPVNTLPNGFPANQNGFIHLIQVQAQPFTPADINNNLPSVPFNAAPPSGFPLLNITVNALNATPVNDAINLVANGTASGAPIIGTLNFTYTISITIEPSRSLWDVNQAMTASKSNAAITFAGGGVVGQLESAVLNILAPAIADSSSDSVIAMVQARINAAALKKAAEVGGCTLNGTPVLPVGVHLAVERVTITPAGLLVQPTLGAFGNILTAVCPTPPPATGSGGGTLCAVLALAATIAPGLNPDPFRTFRDEVLAQSALGRHCTALYYKHSAEVASIILRSPNLLLMPLRWPLRLSKA